MTPLVYTPKDEVRFWSKVNRSTVDCWEWTGYKKPGTGYGRFFIVTGFEPNWRENTAFQAHRVAWTMAKGPIPEGLLVCHRCDNQSCVRPSHLFLGTPQDNMSDMVAKGRPNPPRKIPKELLADIKLRVQRGEIAAHIAKEFKVTKEAIYYHLNTGG